jgi:hypothetical protein
MVELADFVSASRRPNVPALVAGDLNATLGQGPYRIAAALGGLQRLAQGETGLDHVLAVPGGNYAVEPLETRLLRESTRVGVRRVPLSDHPLVLVTLRVFERDPGGEPADRLRTPSRSPENSAARISHRGRLEAPPRSA